MIHIWCRIAKAYLGFFACLWVAPASAEVPSPVGAAFGERHLSWDQPQIYYELLFDVSLAVSGSFLVDHAKRQNPDGRDDFPTQKFDDKVRSIFHGNSYHRDATKEERLYDSLSNFGNGAALIGVLGGLYFEKPDLRLGKYMTFIHSWGLWLFVSDSLKFAVARKRPKYHYMPENEKHLRSVATKASFPSGHAGEIFATVTAGTLLLDLPPLANLGLYSSAIAFSIFRISSEKHFASDVIAGAAIGSGGAVLAYELFQRRNWFGRFNKISWFVTPQEVQVTYRF